MSQRSEPTRTFDEAPSQGPRAGGPDPTPPEAAPPALELLEEIARGGMGAILRAHDGSIGRDVAVKVLLANHRGRPELTRRFLEEARIAGRLQHPGVVPVYALGRMPDGRPYFAMKLIKGRTLTALLGERTDPAADRPRFLAVFEQVCQTLAYAHSKQVIHRDLKPSNVMVGAYGEVQVMDWGLAKVLTPGAADNQECGEHQRPEGISVIQSPRVEDAHSDEAGPETRAGSVLGTPAYMAPEQARGEIEDVDQRADVFGLGAILCEVLTGKPPFPGASALALKRARRGDLDEAFGRLDGCGADADLIGLAKRCLATDPAGRPRDAGEIAAKVTAYRESVERRLREAEVANAEERTKAAEGRKRLRLWGALAAVVLLTAMAGGGGWLRYTQEQAARRATAERAADEALSQADRAEDQAKGIDEAADKVGNVQPETPETAERAAALWRQALGSVEEAERALAADAGNEARGRLAARRIEVKAGLERTEREAQLLKDLDEARAFGATDRGIGFDKPAEAGSYAAALKAYVPETAKAEEAAAAIRAERPAVRLALIVALDEYATCVPGPQAVRLRGLANGAEDDAWRRRFRAAAVAGDVGALKRLAEEARNQELPAVSAVVLADALLKGNARPEAMVLLRQARFQHPADFMVEYRLGMCMGWNGVYLMMDGVNPMLLDEAAGCFWSAIALRPDSNAAYLGLGMVLQEKSDLDGAAACFRKTIELNPKFSMNYWALGLVLRQKGDLDGAAACFSKSTKLDASYIPPHYDFGLVLRDQGKLDEAVAEFRKAVRLSPLFPRIQDQLGWTLRLQGKLDEALVQCKKAVERQPREANFHNSLAYVLLDQGKLDEAAAEFREALRLDPHFAPASSNLAKVERMAAMRDKFTALQKGEFKPRTSDELHGLGGWCEIKKLYGTGTRMYAEAFAEDPKLADDPEAANRYDAACFAALAAAGQGKEDSPPDEKQKADLRRQALAWLQADLALWTKQLQSDKPEDRTAAAQQLRHCQQDSDLAGLRDPAELAMLPADEREACKKLWADVQALLDKAEGKK